MSTTRIMVLADGETYTQLEGARVVEIDTEQLERIECGDARAEDFEDGAPGVRSSWIFSDSEYPFSYRADFRERGSTVERRPEVSEGVRVIQEAAERFNAARDWLCERNNGAEVIYAAMTLHAVQERIRNEYPGNTPGQDGWSSFCEDWSAGTLASALHADALDAATGQSRR